MTTEPVPASNPFLPYLCLGWSVLPLVTGGKLPDSDLLPQCWNEAAGRTRATWKPYQERLATEEEVTSWIAARPNGNVGIVTGTVSGLVVLDLDGAEALMDAWRRGLPRTPTVTTGNGLHLYLRLPGGHVPNRANLLPEVPGYDLRGDGGYIVAPPSIHPSGWCYRWLITLDEVALALPPGWLLERIRTQVAAAARVAPAGAADHNGTHPARWQAYADRALVFEMEILQGTQVGARNDALNRAAWNLGQLVGAGLLDETEVETVLLERATAIGLSRREAVRTIASGLGAGKRHPRYLPDEEDGDEPE